MQSKAMAPILERIVESEDRLARAAAETFVLDEGQVSRQRHYPHVFDANVVRRPRLDRGPIDEALERLAEPLREIGARHLQLACDGAPISDGVARELRARGFVSDRLLAMVLPGAPARAVPDDVAIRPVELRRAGSAAADAAPFAWFADTMDRMSREEPWYTPAVSREIIGSLESKAKGGTLELFVAELAGRPAGAAGLAAHDGTAAIVTVGTVPEARRRGVGQALVLTLAARARAAGCDLVYLVARANDTPKEMYRKFGFAVAFGFDVWLRPPI